MEQDRVWAAVGRVLHAQLLLGHNVALSPKTLVFYISHALAMHDGRTKYLLRVPNAAFHPQFATTYGLDSNIPREPSACAAQRLPLEHVAAEAKLPAEVVSDALREVFLYVGEAVFQGRLVMLELESVGTVLLKRDRMTVHFTDAFLDELYAIDTRKWPVVAKDAGERVRPRPLRDPREHRPTSARSSSASRPVSARPRSAASEQAHKRALDARPVFVANAPAGRNFEDIAEEGPRAVRMQEARLAALRPRQKKTGPLAARPHSSGQMGSPAAAPPQVAPIAAAVAAAAAGDAEEDESIYQVLTPHRHCDFAGEGAVTPTAMPADVADASPESVYNNDGSMISDVALEEAVAHVAAEPASAEKPVAAPLDLSRPPTVAETQHPRSRSSLNIFADPTADPTAQARVGRRRVVPESHRGISVGDLMWHRESAAPTPRAQSATGRRPASRPLYDNLLVL
jgi:hypothetical protein